jgi:lysophospholipase L1-like esterase
MTHIARRGLLAASLAAPLTQLAPAQAAQNSEPDEKTRKLLQDWPDLDRYAQDNATLLASRAPVRLVFMGDSITQGWRDKRPGFFAAGRVGRGIGGQTTPQMVLRMMADVVALKPRAVHIMAGTNDIAGNTGPMTPRMSQDNLQAMCDLARAHGIAVLLASVPPAASFPWRPGLETVETIRTLNRWVRDYAARTRATHVDYHPALATGAGGMKPGMAYDGVHPTEAGYAAMEATLQPILRRLRLT